MGRLLAGVCHFDPLKHQKKKEVRVGTRAGSISIWCAREALADSGVAFEAFPKDRVGIYIGCTEHGNVETENEIFAISKFNYDTKYWSHYHNPRTVANNPAGEASLNLGITGPAYTIGAACAAGNLGLIHAAQMLRLGEVDLAVCGGVSESIHTFGIFAGFKSQGALATNDVPAKASRPFDMARNGIVVSEGGCLYTLERLDDALARGARIYGEIAGYGVNSDASDYVLPNPGPPGRVRPQGDRPRRPQAGRHPHRQHPRHRHAARRHPGVRGDPRGLRRGLPRHPHQQHEELHRPLHGRRGRPGAGRQPAVLRRPRRSTRRSTSTTSTRPARCRASSSTPRVKAARVDTILNNSFGMLGINSTLIVKRFVA